MFRLQHSNVHLNDISTQKYKISFAYSTFYNNNGNKSSNNLIEQGEEKLHDYIKKREKPKWRRKQLGIQQCFMKVVE